jgi:hypothetical protein
MRASRLIGTTVKNTQGEKVGDINDIVLAPDGQIRAVVVGVGGFLGLGEHEVAVSMNSLQMQHNAAGGSATTVTMNATKETLKDAPRWSWSGDQGSTSSGGGSGSTGSGSTTRSPSTTPGGGSQPTK